MENNKYIARVAQQREHPFCLRKVGGSSPSSGSKILGLKMENYKVLTWREAADFFSSNKKAANSIHISSLITTAKKFHIGTPVSFQKTAYTKNDLENLQRAIS